MKRKKKWSCFSFPVLLFFIIFLSVPRGVNADSDSDMLKARIEKLERELQELKKLVKEKDHIKMGHMKAEPAAKGEAASDKFSIKTHGYIKLDASYDDSSTSGNYVVYVPSEGVVKDDNEFNMTARQTRLGVTIKAPEFEGWNASGKVEIDFFGDGPSVHESKAEIMMRHAYVEFSKGSVSWLAGQTWDVMSPLNPVTLNYPAGLAVGNIGYRRPQLRVSFNNKFNEGTGLLTQLAVSRTNGVANEDLDGGGQNDGADSGFPTFQGRVALTTNGPAGKKTVIGISGHYGQEEVDWAGTETDFDSWSGNLDFTIPLSSRFTVMGEAFTGENIDDYYGGILQGVNTATGKEISTTGLWAQLMFAADKKWQHSAGFGIDNPDTEDLNNGNRDKNSVFFVNTMFRLMPKLTLGLEYSYWETKYKNMAKGTDNRLQTSVIYAW